MLTFEQMLVRLVVAIVLGAILGVERELIGKEAGIRTELLVAGGAALFTMASLALPYVAATSPESLNSIIASGGFFGTIASIVAGIGFLGAGLIIKTDGHPHGITTAALVWTTAAGRCIGRHWTPKLCHGRDHPARHPSLYSKKY
jgi:putative Mg2+ transporter-C (MgtC) family protein